ncbi:MAG: ABC transporter ATP-binding protein [Bacilli bacterium]
MSNEKNPIMKGKRNVEKPKDFKNALKKMFKYLGKYKIAVIIVMIFAILSTLFSIVGPKILGDATTILFDGLISKTTGGSGINFIKIGRILLILLVIYILSAVCAYIQGFIMTKVSQSVTYKMRKDISEKIHKIPLKYFEEKTNGEVLSIITNDVDTISQSLNQSITQLITSIVTIIGVFAMMMSINIPLALVSLVILPVSFVIVGLIAHNSQKYFKKHQDYLGHVNGDIEEMYSSQNIIKVFNAEKKQLNIFEKDNEVLYKSAWKSQFLSGLMHPLMNFVSDIGYVGVTILGGYAVIKGKMTVGNIQSFIQYNKNFTRPIIQTAQISNVLQSMMAASERVFEFLDIEEEEFILNSSVDTSLIEGNVVFDHVKFGYNEDKVIIKDFSANVTKGQKIAIVGPTGAGKTTMVKLLMRFYNVTEGKILIDKYNINEFNRGDLRHIFGMVLQDTWLFSGSVMENIRYGRLDASDEEVIQAAKNAHVHHFIQTLPGEYNMEINEETTNISLGQKQLLTIARAILANPKILILDEATSSVDTRTEELIQNAMDELMKGRTSFVIAHRLSTVRDADLILVMNDGDIVEQGTHTELLNKNGFYAKLYNSQFDKTIDKSN